MLSNLPENPTLLQLLEEAGANHISILNLHDEVRRLERKKKAKENAMRDLKDTNCIYFGHEVYLEGNVFRKRKGRKKHGVISCHADIDEENTNYYHEEFTVIYDNGTKRKYKFRDRIHGRQHGGMHGKIDFRYVDCNPYTTKDSYYDAQHKDNGKRHNSTKKTSAMEAREQEYYSSHPAEEKAKEAKISTETTEEAGNFDDFLWYLVDELPEQKYMVLFNYDNGQSWEDHDSCTNEFRGIMTKDKVIAVLTKTFLWNDCGMEVNETEVVEGLKGAKFNWDFGHDEWGWNGYESFTIIPVSRLI